jgi:hypothetical protein
LIGLGVVGLGVIGLGATGTIGLGKGTMIGTTGFGIGMIGMIAGPASRIASLCKEQPFSGPTEC